MTRTSPVSRMRTSRPSVAAASGGPRHRLVAELTRGLAQWRVSDGLPGDAGSSAR